MQQQMKKLEVGSKEYTELSMKSMKFMGPMLKLSMRPIIYTAIPIILLFRWFVDYFKLVSTQNNNISEVIQLFIRIAIRLNRSVCL